jgi:hypothetical protein
MQDLDEEYQRIIRLAIAEVRDSGNLTMVKTFTAEGFYDECKVIYDTHQVDAIFVDHTLALKMKGKETESLNAFAINARNFKVDYPVYLCVLSHLSSLVKVEIGKGKRATSSPTRGSSVLSNESDEILILMRNEMLSKQNLVAIDVYKRRDAPPILELQIVQMLSAYSSFVYDTKFQNMADSNVINADAVLKKVEEMHGDDDEDGFDDEDEDDEDEDDYDNGLFLE